MQEPEIAAGEQMHALAQELFPICRSISGAGTRETLARIQKHIPKLRTLEIPSRRKVLDWTVPDEWNIFSASLTGPNGQKILDFSKNNLHVMGYSEPVDTFLDLNQLQEHLFSIPHQPDAIPYVTSYYNRRWAFCLPHKQREALPDGLYHAVINATLAPGHITLGELVLPGTEKKEILLSTYVCHPSMANNELSGPLVTTWLVKWLSESTRRYTYRILFLPETIGSIIYLADNLEHLKKNVAAGFVITCIGDERTYSYLPSRMGNTLADRTAIHVLKHRAPSFRKYSFLDRGSDERQYCSPGVDLPVCSIMRSKYGEYPEYHTSLDDLTLVTPAGLAGGFGMLKRAIECLEANRTFRTTVLGEPQLGSRGLYPTISHSGSADHIKNMMHILAYADGTRDLLEISEIIGAPMWDLLDTVQLLVEHNLLAQA